MQIPAQNVGNSPYTGEDRFELRNEQVLLVVDNDNVKSTMKRSSRDIDLREVRKVVHRACHSYQQATDEARSFTPVGAVSQAYLFDTVTRMRNEDHSDHIRRMRQIRKSFARAGFNAFVYPRELGMKGYPDDAINQLILSKLPSFDTLILMSSDSDFLEIARYVRRVAKKRVFIIGSPRDMFGGSPYRHIPFVDLDKMMIVYSQTILPLNPRHRAAISRHARTA